MTDPKLLILASLADGDKHGYAIIQDVQQFAGVRLGAGTLYAAITRLEDLGWIRALASEDRRKPYRIREILRAVLDEGSLFEVQRYGGSIVTAGGLVFIAAASDDFIRAFDVETGAELWRGRLPAGGQATYARIRLRTGEWMTARGAVLSGEPTGQSCRMPVGSETWSAASGTTSSHLCLPLAIWSASAARMPSLNAEPTASALSASCW